MNRDGERKAFARRGRGGFVRFVALGLSLAAFGFDRAAEPMSERRNRIEQMPPAQKEQLWRKYERFRALPATEQARLRSIEGKLTQDADAAQLQQVVERFQSWLDRLSSAERAELISLEPQQRLKRIAELRAQEARQLGPDDAKTFAAWFEAKMLRQFPELRANFDSLSAAERRARVAIVLSRQNVRQQLQGNVTERKHRLFTEQDFAELHKALSPKAQQQLDQAAGFHERRMLFGSWIRQLYGKGPGFPSLKLTGISEERLREFFDQELDFSQRAELLRLPSDQMQRQLRRKYHERYPAALDDRSPAPPPRDGAKRTAADKAQKAPSNKPAPKK